MMADILQCLFVFGGALAVPTLWYISVMQGSFEEMETNKRLFGADCYERWAQLEREKSKRFWRHFWGKS